MSGVVEADKMKTLNKVLIIAVLVVIVCFCWDKAAIHIHSDKQDKKFDESDD